MRQRVTILTLDADKFDKVIGAGVLAMPLALSHMGIFLGIFVIVWAGATAGFGLYLQTQCARYLDRGSASFFALSQITYPNAAVVFDAAIAIKCFGVGISYLIIIGDLMPGVVRGFTTRADELEFLVDRHFWITAFMSVGRLFLLAWLSLLTDANLLQQVNCHTSFVPSSIRLAKVYERHRLNLNWLSCYFSSRPFYPWRHHFAAR